MLGTGLPQARSTPHGLPAAFSDPKADVDLNPTPCAPSALAAPAVGLRCGVRFGLAEAAARRQPLDARPALAAPARINGSRRCHCHARANAARTADQLIAAV